MAIVTLFSAGGCSLADVFAWMSDNGLSSPIDITSNVHKTYFNGGDGTQENPYEIATPLQMYYFGWLQNLGLFNVDNDKDGQIDTVYFVLSTDIDMDGYNLPPIGTTEYPFLGNFDGGGNTISNITIENELDHLFEPPEGTDDFEQYAEIVGFFGVVGELTDGAYTYDKQTNQVKNLLLENITVVTHTERALVGFVAGYVNGTVDLVGVVGATVTVSAGTQALSYTSNLSDYSLLGYCTEDYKNEVYVFGSSLAKPGVSAMYTVVPEAGGGSAQGWGGSVKMSEIYTWLTDVSEDRATSSNNNYILERTDIATLDGTTVTTERTTATKLNYTVDGFGSFVITNSQPDYVNFVSGAQKVTEYAYEYSDEDVNVYYITDGTNYLNFYGDEITSDIEGSNTKWYASEGTNGGVLYTVVDNTVYYLTITNDNLSVLQDVNADPGNLPTWENVGNGYTLNNQRLIFNNGNWTLDSSFKIYYRNNNTNYYLTNNGTNDVQAVQNDNQAVSWTMTAVNGGYQISTVINNTTYYLAYTQSGNWFNQNVTGPTLSPNASTWQYENGQFYVSVTSGWGGGTTNYYLRYNNNNDWTIANDTSNSLLSFAYSTDSNVEIISSGTTQKAISFTQREYIDNSLQNGYYDGNGNRVNTNVAGITYFPLSTTVNVSQNSYQIEANNTGYIIGAEYGVNDGAKSEHDQYGNIRIASYASNSMENSTTPYTMTYKTNGKFQTISNRETATLNTLGLQKYADCYEDYIGSIQSSCCGIHFMQASVSTSNMTRITAHLNGKTIDNYQVPTNCIDFNLYDRGFINFVAGSYFTAQSPQNDSFFSIYEIVRDSNDETTIKEIKEISKIYAQINANGDIDTSKPYYYTYKVNNSEVGADSVPNGYQMVFDCRWITHPNDGSYYGASGGPSSWSNNRAFYFEVPVNAGEYAIGSTEGRTGAYLTYLDLAANAQLIERVKEYEEIIETKAEASVPNGVEMLLPSETLTDIDPLNSAFASIGVSASGEITVEKIDDGTIKITTNSGGVTAEYVSVDTALTDKDGKPMTVTGETTTIERITYRDYNINTGETTVTVLSTITTDGQVLYTKTVTVTDSNGNLVGEPTYEESTTKAFAPATVDPDGVPTSSTGDKLIDFAFAYGAEVDLTISYSYMHEGTDGNPTYLITITNPGADAVKVKAILTQAGVDSGITFVVTDGTTQTTLNGVTTAQIVEISGVSGSNDSNDSNGENGGETDEPTA